MAGTDLQTRLVNLAFSMIEHDARLTSLDDDGSDADRARQAWPVAFGECLEALDWAFARRIGITSPISGVPTNPDKPFASALPGDCVRVRRVTNPTSVSWRVYGREIHADCDGQLTITFTVSPPSTAGFSGGFQAAMVPLLAYYLAPGFTRSQNRAEIYFRKYGEKLDAAALVEAQENGDDSAFDFDGSAGLTTLTSPAGGSYPGSY
ncbi:MAG: hypothetical protein AAF678_05660 [Pseudomonadota bacterium]